MTKRLSRDDTASPPSMAAAMDFCELPELLSINGKRAKTVVAVVINIGRSRSRAPQ